MLKFYDNTQEEFLSNPLRTVHDGHLGGNYDILIYIRNNDITKYYIDITLSPVSSTNPDDILGEWGETGFGIKLLSGESRPTETEWDMVRSGESITLDNLGSSTSADVATFLPVWVRVICPGSTSAQLKTNLGLKIESVSKQVGA